MRANMQAFKITYNNGTSYVTSIAAGVSVADVEAYFLNQTVTLPDEKTKATIVSVEKIN